MQAINSNSIFYAPSPPPNNAADLSRYLYQELQAIQNAISQLALGHIDVTTVAPTKPRDGDIRLADGTNWNPVLLGKRFVGYRDGLWRALE